MDRLSQLIVHLFWSCVVYVMNARFERQFLDRIDREHMTIETTIGDFSILHEYVGRHRKTEFSYA